MGRKEKIITSWNNKQNYTDMEHTVHFRMETPGLQGQISAHIKLPATHMTL